MNILLAHNQYNIRGGEDAVFDSEVELLIQSDNQVNQYVVDNVSLTSVKNKLKTIFNTHYNQQSKRELSQYLKLNKPDVAHVHNFFPKLTPAVFDAFSDNGVARVLTLHNYRIVCPTALLMHKGQVCERSLKESAYWAIPYKIYRNSYVGTAVLAHMIEYHKHHKTWQDKVDRFICLTEFARKKFIEAGLPENKLVVKPNFCQDPGFDESTSRIDQALFVGRLSEEKGIDVLLTSWGTHTYPLNIIGEGDITVSNSAINFLGKQTREFVFESVKKSRFIIVPSICYEGFPMAIVEAFACGTPVICSRLGSMEEIVKNDVTGLHFEAGNAADLADKVQWMIDHPQECAQMGINARNEYLAKYTPEKNYQILMDIYQQAIEESKK